MKRISLWGTFFSLSMAMSQAFSHVTVVSQLLYLPYGTAKNIDVSAEKIRPVNISHNQLSYTSQGFDTARNLQTLGGFRHYSVNTKRFVQVDTFSSFTRHQVLNTYAYVAGNPIAYVDQSGHMWNNLRNNQRNSHGVTQGATQETVNRTTVDTLDGNREPFGPMQDVSMDDKSVDHLSPIKNAWLKSGNFEDFNLLFTIESREFNFTKEITEAEGAYQTLLDQDDIKALQNGSFFPFSSNGRKKKHLMKHLDAYFVKLDAFKNEIEDFQKAIPATSKEVDKLALDSEEKRRQYWVAYEKSRQGLRQYVHDTRKNFKGRTQTIQNLMEEDSCCC